jgi:diadenylate cyclase
MIEGYEDKRAIIKKEESEVIIPPKKEKQLTKIDILKKLSPGTELRDGLNDIVKGNLGAIILISNLRALNVFDGGFKVNCKFSAKKLAELAKLDGGLVLSEDFKKILYINTLFVPDRSLSSSETGTRHQAAERTAKQTGAMVIAVSERKGTITVYYGESRYVLQNTEDLLRRTTETLQILEKQRGVFDELLINLNVLEITNLISVADVCTILQRLEMIRKMAKIINEYIVELGKEGIIVRMRMREVVQDIDKKRELIIKDYLQNSEKIKSFFDDLSFDDLLDSENISKILFGDSSETKITPRGYRILSKTNLEEEEIKMLIHNFIDLDKVLNAEEINLQKILESKVESFKETLNKIREQIMVGKKI